MKLFFLSLILVGQLQLSAQTVSSILRQKKIGNSLECAYSKVSEETGKTKYVLKVTNINPDDTYDSFIISDSIILKNMIKDLESLYSHWTENKKDDIKFTRDDYQISKEELFVSISVTESDGLVFIKKKSHLSELIEFMKQIHFSEN
jgi:hypothetical protein